MTRGYNPFIENKLFHARGRPGTERGHLVTDAQTETGFQEIRVKQRERESQAGSAAHWAQRGHGSTPDLNTSLDVLGTQVAGDRLQGQVPVPPPTPPPNPRGHPAQDSGQGLRGLVVAGVLWRGAETHPPGSPRVPGRSAQPTAQGQGPPGRSRLHWLRSSELLCPSGRRK